jgi:hypothetical protein
MNRSVEVLKEPVKHVRGEVLTDDNTIIVQVKPHPFSQELKTYTFPAGLSLQEILEKVQPNAFLRKSAHIFIEDAYCYHYYWSSVRPKPGTLVQIRVIPKGGGGGGGGKNPLRTIAMIAVVAVAAWAAAALAPVITASAISATGATSLAFAQATFLVAKAVVFGAVMAVGSMLVNAIAPPPKPQASIPSLTGNLGKDSPTLFIEGARNQFRPFGVIPRVLGTHKFVPPYAALPYTETVGDNQYVRMVFCWGYGPIVLTDEKIGESALSAFGEVETEFRRGYHASMLSDQGNWDASSGSFPASPVFGYKYTVSVAGTIDSQGYNVGDTIIYNGLYASTDKRAWDINHDKPLTLFPSQVFEDGFDIQLRNSSGWVVRTSQIEADEISIDLTMPNGVAYFNDSGGRSPLTLEFEVQSSPVGANTWTSRGTLSITAAQSNAVRKGLRWATEARDQYDIRIRRITGDYDSTRYVDASFWTALRTFTNDNPVNMDGIALTAMRIRATDQLRGTVDEYNGIITSILKDYDYTDETWKYRPTSNPASHYRTVLQDKANAKPLADARLHFPSIEAFHDYCRIQGWTFNMVRDFAASIPDTISDILGAGRASRTIIDGKHAVVMDIEQSVYVQKFSPRNTWGFESRRVYPEMPDAFRVSFINPERGYRQDELIVYADGKNASNSETFEEVNFPGVTDPDLNWRHGRFHYAQIQLRPEQYKFYADFEYIVAQRGSLVALQHDVLLAGISSGRIKQLITDGNGDIVQIELDEGCEMQTGVTYGVSMRTVSNAKITKQLFTPVNTSELQYILTFNTPLPAAQAPRVGDLVNFGELGQEEIDVIIQTIEPQSNLSALITCIDHAPAVYQADQGPIPPFESNLSIPAGVTYPAITNIRSDEEVLVVLSDGSWIPRIQVTFSYLDRKLSVVTGLETRYRPAGSEGVYQYAQATAQASEMYLEDVAEGTEYDIQARYITSTGVGVWGPLLKHTVIGASTLPPDPPNVILENGIMKWPGYTTPRDFKGFQVKYLSGNIASGSDNWNTANVAHVGLLPTAEFDLTPFPTGQYVFMVKAIDLANNESQNFGYLVYNRVDYDLHNVLLETDLKLTGYPGEVTNGTYDPVDQALEADAEADLYLPNSTGLYLGGPSFDAELYLEVDYKQMTYIITYLVDWGYLPATVLFNPVVEGLWNLTYRTGGDDPYLGGTAADGDLYLGGTAADSELYLEPTWLGDGTFTPWPGSLDIVHQEVIQYKIVTLAGPTQGRVLDATIIQDAPDESEKVEDLVVPPTGSVRVPLTKVYRLIQQAVPSIQDDGNGAVVCRVIDKNPSLGPLIETRNQSGTLCQALLDITIFGVKG